MRKFFAVLLVVLVIFGGYMVFKPKYFTDKQNIGREIMVSYDKTNVRESPNGKKIGELGSSAIVSLTGKRCELIAGGLTEFESWVEIQFEGGTAWITAEAIR